MTTLGRNVAANIAGAVFVGAVTLAAAPLILRWLGDDAYGLAGFQQTVYSMLVLLDLGCSVALNREIAALSATDEGARKTRSVMRTALPFYALIAIVFAAAIALAAPWIAGRWLEDTRLPREVVIDCLRLMGVALAGHFLALPLTAAFLGMQRQVLYSALWSTGTGLRAGGGAAVAFFTRDVRAFFVWQVIASLVQLAMLAVALMKTMPAGRAQWSPDLLRGAWRLARGVAIITAIAAITMQADKLAASRSSTLALFGWYSAAALLAMTAAGGVTPIANAVFPRFTQLLSLGDRDELTLAYHRAMQTMAAIVLPVACILGVWSREVLFVWTGQEKVAVAAGGITALLVAGMAMNGLVTIPYMLQLAHGWTAPAIAMNVVALVTFVPMMFVAGARWGAIGTAATFAAMHAAFLAAGLTVTQLRLLTRSPRWSFVRDAGPPLIASALVAIIGRALLPANTDRVTTAAILVFVSALAFFAAVAASPAVREWMTVQWRAWNRA